MTKTVTKPTTATAPTTSSKAKPQASKPRRKPASKGKRPTKTSSGASKAETVLRLCRRPQGASRAELDAATGWLRAAWAWIIRKNILPRHGGGRVTAREVDGVKRFFVTT